MGLPYSSVFLVQGLKLKLTSVTGSRNKMLDSETNTPKRREMSHMEQTLCSVFGLYLQ